MMRWIAYIVLVLIGIWIIKSIADAYYISSAAKAWGEFTESNDKQNSKVQNEVAFYYRVDSLVQEGHHVKAYEITKERIKMFPVDQPSLTLLLGDIHYALGDIDSAIKLYSKASTMEKNYIKAYSHRGLAYMEKNELDSAIRDLEYAAKGNWDNYYDLGVAQERHHQYEKAKQSYLIYLKHYPERNEVQLRLDTIEMKLGKVDRISQ